MDLNSTLEEIKDYYSNLLILQYRGKEKARKTVSLGVDVYTGDGVVLQLEDILDIDTAQGAQLDIIGKILDCPRNVYGLVNDAEYFSFHKPTDLKPDATGTSLGFSTIDDLGTGFFKSRNYNYQSIYRLEDRDYRILLKFKAIINSVKGSWGGLDKALYSVFGDYLTLKNNKDLSITYFVDSSLTIAIEASEKLGYLMPPSAISYNIIYFPRKVFGFNNKTYKSTALGFSNKNQLVDGEFITKDVFGE